MSLHSALVVDDSKLARITLQRLLQKHNLTVEVAESGVIALEKLKASKPDIIFMDHLMPDLDGFEATQKIKSDPATSHIPVIMCTGKEDTDNYDEQARGIGASGTLSKPPQAEQLALILAAAQSGERLVTATPHLDKELRPVNTETTIEKSVADTSHSVSSELENIFRRLNLLEQATRSLPSLDSFQDRLADAENSLTTMQEAVISLKSAANETPLSAEDISQSVKRALQADFQQQLAKATSESVDADNIKREIIEELDRLLDQKIEAITAPADPPAALDEEALVARIRGDLEGLISERAQPTENTKEIDEEALAAKLAGDVENTLKSLFAEDLRDLEQKLATATDEAISESRKDLDDQLQESIRNIEVNLKAVPGESDLDNLVERIRSEVADIATHSATAAVDLSLEERFSEFATKVQESFPAASQDQGTIDMVSIDMNSIDMDSLVNDPKVINLIDSAVEQQLTLKMSDQEQEIVPQLTEGLNDQSNMATQDLKVIFERVDELDRRQEAIIDRLNEMKELQAASANGSSSSGSTILGIIAVLGAAAAMAKAFGLF